MIRPGSWSYESKSDPRWNISGRASAMSIFSVPHEAEVTLAAKKAELGEEPPADLTISMDKD